MFDLYVRDEICEYYYEPVEIEYSHEIVSTQAIVTLNLLTSI
jgi:hypothetical protein